MINIPVIRWGKPYESLETEDVVHFLTGDPVARVSQANGGLVTRDLRKAKQARGILREFSCQELMDRVAHAADLFENATLPLGDGQQSPDDFVYQQSATTGLPQHMCRKNMEKSCFVLRNMPEILDALTRGLDPEILTRGYGVESRGVVVSYQAQTPILGAVLPSNSPGVHTLWLPVVPLQMGLMLKPGSQEPWTCYRVFSAFVEAGIPAEVIGLYPGGHDVGGALLSGAPRAMIFGGQKTIDQYAGNPAVQVHGPGFSKVLLGDDVVDNWQEYLDVMVESVFINGGRSCINASSIFASRHTREIAEAIASRIGGTEVLPPEHPEAALAAFTVPGVGPAVLNMIEEDLRETGVTDMTASCGDRLVESERCSWLRPVVLHCDSPDRAAATREYMFPFVSVVECPQQQMIDKIGYTLVGTAITDDEAWIDELGQATNIDRLNIGPIPTNRLNWLQPHEGNLIDFLFRSRAYQTTRQLAATV
jgi:acyl-CoA reductase-like NAD-dependent aldehyde dehydrogenase